MSDRLWWNEDAARMYLGKWPVHAEPHGAAHPPGLVVGRVKSQRPGEALTFYVPIIEYEDDERVRTETATTALTDVYLDGKSSPGTTSVWWGRKSWSGAMRFDVLDDQGAGSAGQRS